MRAVIQRVSKSSVSVDGKVIGSIGKGFNILLGITEGDTDKDIKYLCDKIVNLRVFEDENGKLNLSLKEVEGELLVISQFTLYGDLRKGRRPNFMRAMSGNDAKAIYEDFVVELKRSGLKVETGDFGADMKVSIENDGPVTLLLESDKSF